MTPQYKAFMRLAILFLLASYVPVACWESWLFADENVSFHVLPVVIGPVLLPSLWFRGESLVAVPLAILGGYLLVLLGLAWGLRRDLGTGFVVAGILLMLSLGQGLWFMRHFD